MFLMSTFSLEISLFIQILSITTQEKGGIYNFLSEHTQSSLLQDKCKNRKSCGFFFNEIYNILGKWGGSMQISGFD